MVEDCSRCPNVPRAILAGSLWLVHAQWNEEWGRIFRSHVLPQRVDVASGLECRYLAAIEINAPWLLRYFVVVLMKQGRAARTSLSRFIEVEKGGNAES